MLYLKESFLVSYLFLHCLCECTSKDLSINIWVCLVDNILPSWRSNLSIGLPNSQGKMESGWSDCGLRSPWLELHTLHTWIHSDRRCKDLSQHPVSLLLHLGSFSLTCWWKAWYSLPWSGPWTWAWARAWKASRSNRCEKQSCRHYWCCRTWRA